MTPGDSMRRSEESQSNPRLSLKPRMDTGSDNAGTLIRPCGTDGEETGLHCIVHAV